MCSSKDPVVDNDVLSGGDFCACCPKGTVRPSQSHRIHPRHQNFGPTFWKTTHRNQPATNRCWTCIPLQNPHVWEAKGQNGYGVVSHAVMLGRVLLTFLLHRHWQGVTSPQCLRRDGMSTPPLPPGNRVMYVLSITRGVPVPFKRLSLFISTVCTECTKSIFTVRSMDRENTFSNRIPLFYYFIRSPSQHFGKRNVRCP